MKKPWRMGQPTRTEKPVGRGSSLTTASCPCPFSAAQFQNLRVAARSYDIPIITLRHSARGIQSRRDSQPITVEPAFTVKNRGKDLACGRWQEMGRSQGIYCSFVHVDEVLRAARLHAEGHG
jgi:hypothetical protein